MAGFKNRTGGAPGHSKLADLQALRHVQRLERRNPGHLDAQIAAAEPVAGKPARVKPMPRRYGPVADLGDGRVGYYADTVSQDDCFRAAIATAVQAPIEQVPDPRLHHRLVICGDDPGDIDTESWLKMAQWLERRGMHLTHREKLPVDHERWVGVCAVPAQADNPFADHCLVMSYKRVVFDPSAKAIPPPGMKTRTYGLADVTYGLTFDPIKEYN